VNARAVEPTSEPPSLHVRISSAVDRAAYVQEQSNALIDECRLVRGALHETLVACRSLREARAASRGRRGARAFGNGQLDARMPSGPG